MYIVIIVLILIPFFLWWHTTQERKHRRSMQQAIDALANNTYQDVPSPNSKERRLSDEQNIFAEFGFPVGMLHDIIQLADSDGVRELPSRIHNVLPYKETSGLGIWHQGPPLNHRHMVTYNLIVRSGDLSITLAISQTTGLWRVCDITEAELWQLTTLYELWMNYNVCRMGILHLLESVSDNAPYKKIVGAQLGLTDYTGTPNIGACWWRHQHNKDTDIHTYEISYLGNHIVIWISLYERRYQINDDYLELNEFKTAVKEICNG